MPPKKKEQQQKMSLGDFLTDGFGGGSSWADEVEETYVSGTQPLPPSDRYRSSGSTSAWQDRGYSVRERSPQRLPDKPPFTAHLGNLSYDATSEAVSEFFEGCEVMSVRIIEDRELMRPKGFGYVEFTTLDGLKKALTLDGESFQGRMIKIKIADPPRMGDGRGESTRDLSDWSRKGPLPDIPGRNNRQPSDFGERRPPRDAAPEGPPAAERSWERRGPLSPIPGQESGPRDGGRPRPSPEGMGERSESYRGNRQPSATWGEGRQDSRPRRDPSERPDRPERPERTVTAAEKDTQWRSRMRPDAAAPAAPSQDGNEAPSSPSATPAVPAQAPAPVGRPKLNLAKRTVSEAADAASPTGGSDAKASPFGAARPIDTAAREKQVEEKRQQAIQEKREADEKAKEERRVAKEAAAKAEAEAKENPTEAPEAEVTEEAAGNAEATEAPNGASPDQKVPIRTREPREPREPKDPAQSPKPRAFETSSWRTASGEQRAPRGGGRGGRGGTRGDRAERGDGPPRGPRNEGRGGRANGSGSPAQPSGATSPDAGDGEPVSVDADGWTTVPKKARGGRA